VNAQGHIKIAAMLILQTDKEILLMIRNKEPNKGKYLPVGGKLLEFENPEAAAIRECHEETGFIPKELKLAGILCETSPVQYNWLSYIYTSRVEKFIPPKCEEGELVWVDINSLSHIQIPQVNNYVYEHFLKQKLFILSASYNEQLELILLKDEILNQLVYESQRL